MRNVKLLVALAVLAAVAAIPALAQAPMRVGNEYPLRIDSRGPSHVEAVPTDRGARWAIHHPGATYIAIHFAEFDLVPGDSVTVSDASRGQAYTLTGGGKMDAGTFWSQHVKGDTAVIELVQRGEKRGKGFVVDSYAGGFVDLGEPESVEAICGVDNKKNAVCYQSSHPTEYARSRAVARLLIQGTSLCTGWLASASSHLVTNEHCITSATAATNTDYEFGAEAPNCTSSNCQLCWPGTVFSGATFIQDSAALDYALVRITSGNPAATYGFLQIDNRDAIVGEQIYIPQHAGGDAKQLGIEDTSAAGGVCRVSTIGAAACTGVATYNDVGYSCDTEGGSSGSPVLASSSHRVVALHHCANCPNRGVPIDLVCSEICGLLGGGGGCQTNADCNDSNACTTDTCNAGTCSNTPLACGSGGATDGCCAAGCAWPADGDCPQPCGAAGTLCTSNSQCCSNSCKGKPGRKTCR